MQMEQQLHHFIEEHRDFESVELELDGAARFVLHQVAELARDCLSKSELKLITSGYFYELSEKLEKLLHDVSG